MNSPNGLTSTFHQSACPVLLSCWGIEQQDPIGTWVFFD